MKCRVHPRGSTLLAAMSIVVILALIVFGVLAYTGSEQGRSGRSVRDISAQTCVESAAQFGRKFYGDNYMTKDGPGWRTMLSATSKWANPEVEGYKNWEIGSYGRLDGREVTDDLPAEFRVTIRDNADEFPVDQADPTKDSDMQVILRAECLIPELALSKFDVVESPRAAGTDASGWHGRVMSESSETRRNKVIEMVITLVPDGCYAGQATGGCTGDRNSVGQ